MFILFPLHVSALVGHLQAEYTIISESLFTEVEVTLRPTVSRPVRLGALRLLE
jgi:hypothetical protein